VSLYGYEGEDWDRYKDHLVAGTLDISNQGIVLVNGGKGYYEEDNSYMIFYGLTDYTYTNYKIGDSITFVDPEELYELVQSEMKKAAEYDTEKLREDEEYEALTKNLNGFAWIVEAARQKLISEGKCKTYIIEGIVDRDVNHVSQGPVFIMPLDKYLAATGSTKDDYTGFQYHIENTLFSDISSEEYSEAAGADLMDYDDPDAIYSGDRKVMPNKSDYRLAVMFAGTAKPIIYGVAIIFVIVFVNCLNIYNVTMSNIAQRQNEFAQLRAIGMTKSGLFKAVVLEGVIMWFLACVIGVIGGLAIEYMIHHYILFYIIGQGLFINRPAIIVAMVLSFIVLVGAYYFPMKRMRLDVAEELMRSGE
jgi:ABC-type antimicrobial peptide transport system permease subunit